MTPRTAWDYTCEAPCLALALLFLSYLYGFIPCVQNSFSRFWFQRALRITETHKENQRLTNSPGVNLYWLHLGAGRLILEQKYWLLDRNCSRPGGIPHLAPVFGPYVPWVFRAIPFTLVSAPSSFLYYSVFKVSIPRGNNTSTKPYLSTFPLWADTLGFGAFVFRSLSQVSLLAVSSCQEGLIQDTAIRLSFWT